MEIKNEEDMIEFCKKANKESPFSVINRDFLLPLEVSYTEKVQDSLIKEGVIPPKPISHLQQGISNIDIDCNDKKTYIEEKPFLFPNPNITNRPELKDYFGPMTGVLVNCYDPEDKIFLFQMRGKDIDSPFGFQAAAAGMGRFRENLYVTARKELEEEAGILYPYPLNEDMSLDVLPFMKGKFPQLLFSFGFQNDLSRFPKLDSLDAIAEFEETQKTRIKQTGEKLESYPFTIPYCAVEKVAEEINNQKKFYGPIYQSVINFIKNLR